MIAAHRIAAAKTAIWLLRIRFRTFEWLIANPAIAALNLTNHGISKRRTQKIELLKEQVARHTTRTNSFCIACKTGLPPDKFTAEKSYLLSESNRLRTDALALTIPNPGVVCVAEWLQRRVNRFLRKDQVLGRLLKNIETSPTFFADLLIWAVVPSPYSEELTGDLEEEYCLRVLTDGELEARAWHREQVVSTVAAYMADKAKRLLSIVRLLRHFRRIFW